LVWSLQIKIISQGGFFYPLLYLSNMVISFIQQPIIF